MDDEPSYVRYKYLVRRPISMHKDPETIRKCREIIQEYFRDKIIEFNSHSLIRLENAGINIGIDKKENINTIKITFNVIEVCPDKQEWIKYSKMAWGCHSKLLYANKGQIVKCYLSYSLRTLITDIQAKKIHVDTIPEDLSVK